MFPFVFADISADIVRVLEIGYTYKRLFWWVAEVANGIFAGSHIQKAVVIDGKFGVGEWFGNRFLVAETSQGSHIMGFPEVYGFVSIG